MARTVELLLDPDLDRGVRALWDRLAASGARSLATHPHATNRPHVTLAVVPSLSGLPDLGLPVPVRLGPARMLGRALVLEVSGLREVHARVWAAVGSENPLHAPDRWVPHVSLALRATPGSDALLHGLPPMSGRAVAARSYDLPTRTVVGLPAGRDSAE
ncbi:2'-5' RNA ligase family protein [Catenuloplanes atrovinosus]|uniref:2'-5' RNA ligase superfamily protein n=1 Tax=Catenuloplanes atrovinosus TaxID=137266 RepID=A0AAE3YN43_9ACTN|nr:2'-5' RNA ligase family protein [Catenuloplanes atrovinosus]MDR7275545.1 hypothetical protein [Catenuloplanes atrovinosus]